MMTRTKARAPVAGPTKDPAWELGNALEQSARVIEGVAQGLDALSQVADKDYGTLLELLEEMLRREAHALVESHRAAALQLGRRSAEPGG